MAKIITSVETRLWHVSELKTCQKHVSNSNTNSKNCRRQFFEQGSRAFGAALRCVLTIMLLLCTVVPAVAQTTVTQGGIRYTLNSDNTAIVSYHTGDLPAQCTIPATITSGDVQYTVTAIGNSAFVDCHGLTSISIPLGVTAIGDDAFNGCDGLTSIIIPPGVTTIGSSAFKFCLRLTSITSNAQVPPTMGTAVWYDVPTTAVVTVPCGTTAAYRQATGWGTVFADILENVPSIAVASADEAVGTATVTDCTVVTATPTPNANYEFVSWTDAVGTVVSTDNPYTYTGTDDIELTANFAPAMFVYDTIDAVNKYVAIRKNPAYTEALGDIVIPATVQNGGVTYTVTAIAGRGFYSESTLIGVTFADGSELDTIGEYAFANCSSLSTISLPASLKVIKKDAFFFSGLTSITLGAELDSVGAFAFYGCNALTTVQWNSPNLKFAESSGNYLFAYNTSIQSVAFGSTVEVVPYYAFVGCSNLTSVTFAEGSELDTIGEYAFYYCSSLSTISLPASLKYIDGYAFESCTGLTSITSNAQVPPTMGTYVWYNVPATAVVTVPCGTLSAYRGATGWGTVFNDIREDVGYSITVASANEAVGTATMGDILCSGIELTATAGCGYRFTRWSNGQTANPLTVVLTKDTALTAIFEAYTITGDTAIVTCDSYTWVDGNTYTESTNIPTYTYTAANGCDSVVTLNLTINRSTTGIDEITACDSYTWIDGVTYTSSNNTAQYTLTNAADCDSVVTLNLTINRSTTGIDEITACDSYTWIDGNTYTESNNTATYTLTNAAGCDSVVTLNLTINRSTSGTDVITACDSYTWIDGVTYTASNNTATYTLENAAGCDSVVTLNLTINSPVETIATVEACESYIWVDGVTYTESTNTPTYTYTTAGGCDSVVTLHLTINHSVTGTDVVTACGSYTWIDGVTYTESTNTPTYTLTSAGGCDSVVTLHLTIKPVATGADTVDVCDYYTWVDGNTYTESGEYRYTYTAANGCDSVVTLYLTINECLYTITVGVFQNDTTGTTIGSGEYSYGDTVTIVAEPKEGYRFIQWQDGYLANPRQIVVTGDARYNAIFGKALDIDEMTDDNNLDNLTFYPNPTRGMITFSTEDIRKVEIMDGMGRMVAVFENSYRIDLSDLAKGYYTMCITTSKGITIRRVVKQ